MANKSKPLWASKTIVTNAVAVVAAVAIAFGVDVGAEMQGEIVALVMGVANIALRFVTTKPVSV